MYELPSHYACTGCGKRFAFEFRRAVYYCGTSPIGGQLPDADVLQVPVRPGWCKTCDKLCAIEDIQPLRTFEDAYGAVRAGKDVEYPEETFNYDLPEAIDRIATYLRWRLGRAHPSRALCCGGTDYQFLDVEQPLLKHAECEFGVVEAVYPYSGPYNGPGPGVYSPANIRVFDGEGELIGRLTTRSLGGATLWEVVPAAYGAPQSD